MAATVSALLSALLLSELAFNPHDVAYWRRWLGRFGYTWRRLTLALVPAALAVTLGQLVPDAASISQQIFQGLLAGVAAAALLRADTGRVHFRPGEASFGDSARAATALSWIYDRACQRLDVLARRRIVQYLARQKVAGPNHPGELLVTAEELAGVLRQERTSGSSRSRKAAQERLDSLREQMDMLSDPLAHERQRHSAAFTLAEMIIDEMTERRWDRPPAYDGWRKAR